MQKLGCLIVILATLILNKPVNALRCSKGQHVLQNGVELQSTMQSTECSDSLDSCQRLDVSASTFGQTGNFFILPAISMVA